MYEYHEDFTLPTNHIFVFGSNYRGRHGAGAAKVALQYGAILGNGIGIQGRSYAIPTKDCNLISLDLHIIHKHVNYFLEFARSSEDLFWITKIGCGLAGYFDNQIAPMFLSASSNCNFPEPWKKYLEP
jgi:hypothetical protein